MSSSDQLHETFDHLLTVLMIMFGDAREEELRDQAKSERLVSEAFEYANSWLAQHNDNK